MIPHLPLPSPGQPVTAELIRRIIEALRAQRVTAGVGLRMDERPDGVILSLNAPAASAADTARAAAAWSVVETKDGWGVYVPDGALTVWLQNAAVDAGEGVAAGADGVMAVTLAEADDPDHPGQKKAAATEIWLAASLVPGGACTLTAAAAASGEEAEEGGEPHPGEKEEEDPAALRIHIATIKADGTLDQRHVGCLELAALACDALSESQATLEAGPRGLQLYGADADTLGSGESLLHAVTPSLSGSGDNPSLTPGPGMEDVYVVAIRETDGVRKVVYLPFGTGEEEQEEEEEKEEGSCDDHPGDNFDEGSDHPGDGFVLGHGDGYHPGDLPDWCK